MTGVAFFFSFGHILKQVISFKDNVIIIIILIFIKGGRLDIDEHAVRYWWVYGLYFNNYIYIDGTKCKMEGKLCYSDNWMLNVQLVCRCQWIFYCWLILYLHKYGWHVTNCSTEKYSCTARFFWIFLKTLSCELLSSLSS